MKTSLPSHTVFSDWGFFVGPSWLAADGKSSALMTQALINQRATLTWHMLHGFGPGQRLSDVIHVTELRLILNVRVRDANTVRMIVAQTDYASELSNYMNVIPTTVYTGATLMEFDQSVTFLDQPMAAGVNSYLGLTPTLPSGKGLWTILYDAYYSGLADVGNTASYVNNPVDLVVPVDAYVRYNVNGNELRGHIAVWFCTTRAGSTCFDGQYPNAYVYGRFGYTYNAV